MAGSFLIHSFVRTMMVLVGICILAQPSHAADRIDFVDKTSFDHPDILSALSGHSFQQIAAIDLNNDSIDEYILVDMLDGKHHEYQIIAANGRDVTLLGSVRAIKLMAAYDMNHGVRNLLAYDDARNDFEYEVYHWDALASRFISDKTPQSGGRE